MKVTQCHVLAVCIVATAGTTDAFVPSSLLSSRQAVSRRANLPVHSASIAGSHPRLSLVPHDRSSGANRSRFALRMAAEDFNESKYTEAAWSSIAALTKVADFYQASTVEAPFLLDVMLNPSKHAAGENAEAAKKVVEKSLSKAGVDVKELRSELEKFLAKQARISDNSQKVMGRTLQKVLDTARVGQSVLGVRSLETICCTSMFLDNIAIDMR